MSIRAIIAAAAAITSVTVQAQGSSSTLGTSAYPVSRGGEVEGCEIEFTHVAQDFAYAHGAPVLINGSIAVKDINGVPRITFKLVLDDIQGDASSSDVKTTPFRPASIALVGEDGRSNIRAQLLSVPGETPGSLLSAYPFDDANGAILGHIVQEHSISAVYNRKLGGQDVRFTVDLDVTRQNGESTTASFMDCMKTLADTKAQ